MGEIFPVAWYALFRLKSSVWILTVPWFPEFFEHLVSARYVYTVRQLSARMGPRPPKYPNTEFGCSVRL